MPSAIWDHKKYDTAEEIDPSLETFFGDTQYCFSSAQDSNKDSLIFKTSGKFSSALVNRSASNVLFREATLTKNMNFLSKQYCHLHSHLVELGQRQSVQQQYHFYHVYSGICNWQCLSSWLQMRCWFFTNNFHNKFHLRQVLWLAGISTLGMNLDKWLANILQKT